jgi:hypothetical protein
MFVVIIAQNTQSCVLLVFEDIGNIKNKRRNHASNMILVNFENSHFDVKLSNVSAQHFRTLEEKEFFVFHMFKENKPEVCSLEILA